MVTFERLGAEPCKIIINEKFQDACSTWFSWIGLAMVNNILNTLVSGYIYQLFTSEVE